MKNKNIEIWYNHLKKRKLGVDFMKNNFNAIDFANWFLWYNQVEQIEKTIDEDDLYEGLSHLKVQKLLYYADGICLAINNESLFKEKIYAWQHGPVIKEVYQELSINGRDEIPFDDKNEVLIDTIKKINSNSDLYDILVTTYDSYAGYTAWQLREKTHIVGGPWQVTVDTKGMQAEIEQELIRDYFKEHIVKVDG